MDSLMLLQVSEKDPHGFIITIVSVAVVFAALTLLYCAYACVGKVISGGFFGKMARRKADVPETPDSDVHDHESYVITIKRKGNESDTYVPTAAVPTITTTPVKGVSEASGSKTVMAPLPGVVVSINVNEGDVVRPGQVVAILEAMKMENEILAEFDGTVTRVHLTKGESVLEGAPIVTLA